MSPTSAEQIVVRLVGRRGASRFAIIEDEEGAAHPRICAVNAWDVEIVGAYQPSRQRPYWRAYVTPELAAAAGIEFHPEHYSLASRDEARHWVTLVAQLYVKAAHPASSGHL